MSCNKPYKQSSKAPANRQQGPRRVPALSNFRSSYAEGQIPPQGTSNMPALRNNGLEESNIAPVNRRTGRRELGVAHLVTASRAGDQEQPQVPANMHNPRHLRPEESRNAPAYHITRRRHVRASYSVDLPSVEVRQISQAPANMQMPQNRVEESSNASVNCSTRRRGVQASHSMASPVVENQIPPQEIRSISNIPSSYYMTDRYHEKNIHHRIQPTEKQQAAAASSERQKRSKKPQTTQSPNRIVEKGRPNLNKPLPSTPTSSEKEVATAPAETREPGQMLPQAMRVVPGVPLHFHMNHSYPAHEPHHAYSFSSAQETDAVGIERRKRIYAARQLHGRRIRQQRCIINTYGPRAHGYRAEPFPEHREELAMRNPNVLAKPPPLQRTKQLSRSASQATAISEPRATARLTNRGQSIVEEPIARSSFAVVQSGAIHCIHEETSVVNSRNRSRSVGSSRGEALQTAGELAVPSQISSRSATAPRSVAQTLALLEQERYNLRQEVVQMKVKHQGERQKMAADRQKLARWCASIENFASQHAAYEEKLAKNQADASREQKFRAHYEWLYTRQQQEIKQLQKQIQGLKEEAEKNQAFEAGGTMMR